MTSENLGAPASGLPAQLSCTPSVSCRACTFADGSLLAVFVPCSVAMESPFERIAECHPALRDAAAAASEYWEPEPVPLSVGLGALGNALVKAERDIPDEALTRMAACVEEALGSRGDVRDAVATGFLEAIAHRADQAPTSVERIVRKLGPRAVEYIRAWDEFSGSSTPGAR